MTSYWTEEQVRESVRKTLENNYGIMASLEEYGYSGAEVEAEILNELLNMTPGFTMTMDLSKNMLTEGERWHGVTLNHNGHKDGCDCYGCHPNRDGYMG